MIFIVLIYLAFISLGLPDSILGSSWPLMNVELGVPINNAGIASFIISGGTIVSSLFSYKLIRVIGTGKVTIISVAMTAAALLGFSASPSFLWLLACAVPLGLGAGAVDAGLNKFVAEHYEAKHMNWLHGFWGVGAMLGPIIMSALVLGGNTWRTGYLTISIIQFSLVLLLLFSLPMWKRYEPGGNESKTVDEDPLIENKPGLISSLKTKGSIFGMFTFFMVASIEATMMLWGSSYLVKVEQITPERAAGWVSLFFLGITAGRMMSGFISLKMSNEGLIRAGAILTITGFLIMLLPLPTPFTLLAFVIIGTGIAPIYPSMLHQTPIYFGKHNAQAAMGMQMAFAYTGTTLVAPLLGLLFAQISFNLMPYILLACASGLLIFREILIKRKNGDRFTDFYLG